MRVVVTPQNNQWYARDKGDIRQKYQSIKRFESIYLN